MKIKDSFIKRKCTNCVVRLTAWETSKFPSVTLRLARQKYIDYKGLQEKEKGMRCIFLSLMFLPSQFKKKSYCRRK